MTPCVSFHSAFHYINHSQYDAHLSTRRVKTMSQWTFWTVLAVIQIVLSGMANLRVNQQFLLSYLYENDLVSELLPSVLWEFRVDVYITLWTGGIYFLSDFPLPAAGSTLTGICHIHVVGRSWTVRPPTWWRFAMSYIIYMYKDMNHIAVLVDWD